MKKFLLSLTLLIAATCFSQKKLYINPGSYNSSPVQPLPGDTVVLKAGNYGYINFANISGTSQKRITLISEGGANFLNGIAYFDCKYWHISGGITQNIFIGNNQNTVAINVQGKSGNFEIDHIIFSQVYSALWFKTEPTLYADTSYWSTLTMDSLYIHDCEIHRSFFEGIYIGSTDQKADRACKASDGKTYFPFPAKVKDIRIENIIVDSTERTGAQVSGLLSGNNYLKNCTFNVCGLSHESNQGACFRIGGNSYTFTISGCSFKQSWLYAVQSQGAGTIKFIQNKVDSATRIGTSINPQQMAAVEFDTYNYPTTIKIKGNTIGYSNNNIPVVVYGSAATLTAGGNVYANNKTTGSFQNQTGIVFASK